MKVKVRAKKIYTVTINAKEYEMSKVNEMAGMIQLRTKDGKEVVVNCETFFDRITSAVLDENEFEAEVIKISPSLSE